MEVLILPDNYCFFHVSTPVQVPADYYQVFDKSCASRAGKDGWKSSASDSAGGTNLTDPYAALVNRKKKPVATVPDPLPGFSLATCIMSALKAFTPLKNGVEEEEEEENIPAPPPPSPQKRIKYEFETLEDVVTFVLNPEFVKLVRQ